MHLELLAGKLLKVSFIYKNALINIVSYIENYKEMIKNTLKSLYDINKSYETLGVKPSLVYIVSEYSPPVTRIISVIVNKKAKTVIEYEHLRGLLTIYVKMSDIIKRYQVLKYNRRVLENLIKLIDAETNDEVDMIMEHRFVGEIYDPLGSILAEIISRKHQLDPLILETFGAGLSDRVYVEINRIDDLTIDVKILNRQKKTYMNMKIYQPIRKQKNLGQIKLVLDKLLNVSKNFTGDLIMQRYTGTTTLSYEKIQIRYDIDRSYVLFSIGDVIWGEIAKKDKEYVLSLPHLSIRKSTDSLVDFLEEPINLNQLLREGRSSRLKLGEVLWF